MGDELETLQRRLRVLEERAEVRKRNASAPRQRASGPAATATAAAAPTAAAASSSSSQQQQQQQQPSPKVVELRPRPPPSPPSSSLPAIPDSRRASASSNEDASSSRKGSRTTPRNRSSAASAGSASAAAAATAAASVLSVGRPTPSPPPSPQTQGLSAQQPQPPPPRTKLLREDSAPASGGSKKQGWPQPGVTQQLAQDYDANECGHGAGVRRGSGGRKRMQPPTASATVSPALSPAGSSAYLHTSNGGVRKPNTAGPGGVMEEGLVDLHEFVPSSFRIRGPTDVPDEDGDDDTNAGAGSGGNPGGAGAGGAVRRMEEVDDVETASMPSVAVSVAAPSEDDEQPISSMPTSPRGERRGVRVELPPPPPPPPAPAEEQQQHAQQQQEREQQQQAAQQTEQEQHLQQQLHEAAAALAPRASQDVSEEQLMSYAETLGMRPRTVREDRLLLWVAAEGIGSPVPADWCWHHTPEGEVYYIHRGSRHTQWEHPADEQYRGLFKQQAMLLYAVMAELDELSACGWSLPLPMTRIVLLAESFYEEGTELFLHRSWAVDSGEYAGEPTRIRPADVPLQMIRELRECSVSPAQPGWVQLSMDENETGAVTTHWLEVSKPGPHTTVIVFREHFTAPCTNYAEPAMLR